MEVDASQLPKPKSRLGTQGHRVTTFQLTPTGLSPSTTDRSRSLRLRRLGRTSGPQPHISRRSPCGIRFELFPLRSLLLRESQLVSLPPLTKMFPFRGFPLPCGSAVTEATAGDPIRASPDQRLHTPTRGLSRFATPFLSVRAKLSPRRRNMSGLSMSPASN